MKQDKLQLKKYIQFWQAAKFKLPDIKSYETLKTLNVKKRKLFLIGVYLTTYFSIGTAQIIEDRFEVLEEKLTIYASNNPKIDKRIDISITGTIQEFALAFSKETKLNLTVDPSIDKRIVSNFADTRPRDILLHICKFYDLDLTFSGSIISLIPYVSPAKPIVEKKIDISFNNYNNRLELNLKNDTLDYVVKLISELSKKNVIATKASSMLIVDGYIGSADFEDALEQFAKRNELSLTKEDNNYYVLDLLQKAADTAASNNNGKKGRKNNRAGAGAGGRNNQKFVINISRTDTLGEKYLNVDVTDVELSEVIKEGALKTEQNFFLFTEPKEKITIKLEDVTYAELLSNLLPGTNFIFKNIDGIYLIGDNKSTGLKDSETIQLQHRSVKGILDYIPSDISTNLEIKEFIELNSLIVNGPNSNVEELRDFIFDIDKPVPVVMIELLIIDVQHNSETRAGFEAGLADAPVKPGGSLFPGIDFTFSANGINQLLGLLAGNGVVNLGQVKPNFYATLQFVEDNGFINVRSKPRLSTLNGAEATVSLGETRYYLNERTTLQGNQNPVTLQDRIYEPVNADFSIRIIPIVSGDEYVTLEIEVSQADFIGKIQSDAPPPQVNRTFNSNIRMQHEEMIVLGGLESKSVEDSGTGVPWISRVPIIKWFFSKRRKANKKTKLLVFVKPTIIY